MSQDTKLHRRIEDAEPDPAYYREIGGDETLRRVLDAFYEKVFVDPVLAPFFARSDKETLKGKQFGFLRMRFTGERGRYMGQRPRNAHHFMVISDADFDHRQAILRETLERDRLAPAQVARWLEIEEVFRRQIVKDKPVPLFYRGVRTFWAAEPREEPAVVATVCDTCGAEIEAGASLWLVNESVACGRCVAAARKAGEEGGEAA